MHLNRVLNNMALIEGYSSNSDPSDAEVESNAVSEQNKDVSVNHASGNKRFHFTKSELKKRKRQRALDSPWGSWSEDNSDNDETSRVNESDIRTESHHTELESDTNSDEQDIETEEKSSLYIEEHDYYNNSSILKPPFDVDIVFDKAPMTFKTYLPKSVKHVFDGHKNGTTQLRFIPRSGHLFLSGGNDNCIRIWDFYHERKCLRDYQGHSKAINSLDFTTDGSNFVSSSFDKTIKLWGTESGIVTKRVKCNSLPTSCQFRPNDPNEFIVGLSDSRILHYDVRVAEKDGLIQTYDHHNNGILDLKYFPDGSKFISSSEDKSVRIWNSGVNIPIKQISDTTQHSMPVLEIHPNNKYFCAQSMNNTICTFDMKPKYKRVPAKTFSGQKSVGYSIGFDFSPDGHYVCSGDIRSKIVLWDWRTTKQLKEISLPGKSPISEVKWHPQETSKLICSGPSGKIYMLD